jgi:Ca2+/Na+ antiporter
MSTYVALLSLLLLFLVWIILFIDLMTNKNIADNERVLWILGFFFLPFIPIIYLFTDYSKRGRNSTNNNSSTAPKTSLSLSVKVAIIVSVVVTVLLSVLAFWLINNIFTD